MPQGKLLARGTLVLGLQLRFPVVITACVSIGQVGPFLQAFSAVKGASPGVIEVVERKSEIDVLHDTDGNFITDYKGNVRFSGVLFRYNRRDKNADNSEDSENEYRRILENVSLSVLAGISHALAGPNGGGKSASFRLIERFCEIGKTLSMLEYMSYAMGWK